MFKQFTKENEQTGLVLVISQKVLVSKIGTVFLLNSNFCNQGQKDLNLKTWILDEFIE